MQYDSIYNAIHIDATKVIINILRGKESVFSAAELTYPDALEVCNWVINFWEGDISAIFV